MLVHLKTALAVLVMASVPMHLGAEIQRSSSDTLAAKEVRQAERDARTPDDHLRIAIWYRTRANEIRNELTAQEELVNYWAQQPGMASRTKIPNPLWSAQALARLYRERLENATKLADRHQKLAESLDVSAGQ
jgi:hypothetical protein